MISASKRERDPVLGDIYLAGERVLQGHYRDMDTGRVIYVEAGDVLPASLNGRVACYARARFTWSQLQREWDMATMDEEEETLASLNRD